MRSGIFIPIVWIVVLSTLYSFAWGLDINTASAQQLTQLKGIGEKTANRILEERRKGGAFLSVDDFRVRVKGMGKKKIQQLQEQGVQIGEDKSTSQNSHFTEVSTQQKDVVAEGKVYYVRPKGVTQ